MPVKAWNVQQLPSFQKGKAFHAYHFSDPHHKYSYLDQQDLIFTFIYFSLISIFIALAIRLSFSKEW